MAIKPKNANTDPSGDKKKPVVSKVKDETTKKSTKKAPQKPKKPARTKYDWVQLKAEYLSSDFIDVAPFLRQRIGQDTTSNKAVATASK